jgi:hypothetical protein
MYVVRMAMRFIDATFNTKPISNPQQRGGNTVNPASNPTQAKPKPADEDYIEYEEITPN